MFGCRLWHPDDRDALTWDLAQAMFAAIDRRMAEDAKEAKR